MLNNIGRRCLVIISSSSSTTTTAHQSIRNLNRNVAASSLSSLKRQQNYSSSSTNHQEPIENEVRVHYEGGQPIISLPLPSRRERCQFTLRPVTHTVSHFITQVKEEDKGVDSVLLYSPEGERIASSTSIQQLILRGAFRIKINDDLFESQFPSVIDPSSGALKTPQTDLSEESLEKLMQIKNTLSQLNNVLSLPEHQITLERKYLREIEELESEIAPYAQHELDMKEKSQKYSDISMWGGLGLMGIQFGAFARLTWWEYSWDIMEPVTYFATYSTAILGYAYFLLTRTPYEYEFAKNRVFLSKFYKNAQKEKFDVDHYNKLKETLYRRKYDLSRLRDPHQLHIPPPLEREFGGEAVNLNNRPKDD